MVHMGHVRLAWTCAICACSSQLCRKIWRCAILLHIRALLAENLGKTAILAVDKLRFSGIFWGWRGYRRANFVRSWHERRPEGRFPRHVSSVCATGTSDHQQRFPAPYRCVCRMNCICAGTCHVSLAMMLPFQFCTVSYFFIGHTQIVVHIASVPRWLSWTVEALRIALAGITIRLPFSSFISLSFLTAYCKYMII